MAGGSAMQFSLLVGTVVSATLCIGMYNAPAVSASRTVTAARQGKLHMANNGPMEPQAYLNLIGEPLIGETGSTVELPMMGSNIIVFWDVKQGENLFRSGSGSVLPLAQLQPGTYTVAVMASDGVLSVRGSCLLIVNPVVEQSMATGNAVLESAAIQQGVFYDEDVPYLLASSQELVQGFARR